MRAKEKLAEGSQSSPRTPLYALKVVNKSALKNKAHRVLNEREILTRVRHPNIIKLCYAFQTPDRLCVHPRDEAMPLPPIPSSLPSTRLVHPLTAPGAGISH